MSTEVEVAIVGAGLAGLFLAAELRSRGVTDIALLDAAPGAGGLVQSVETEGYLFEPAAGSFLLPHPVLSKAFAQLGSAVVPAHECASTRFVYTRGRLVELAPSPRAAFAPIASVRAKLRAVRELRVPRADSQAPSTSDESLEDFLTRRFGVGLGALGAHLAASGVFAGDPTQLSASAAFPALTGLEAEFGSVLKGMRTRMKQRPEGVPRPRTHVPAGSMATLAQQAVEVWADRVQFNAPVRAVRYEDGAWHLDGAHPCTAKHVAITIDPADAACIVEGELSRLLQALPHAPVAAVALGGSIAEVQLPAGFGVLPGHDVPLGTRGVLFESSYAPHRAPSEHSLAKAIVGGAGHEVSLDCGDAELIERTVTDTSRLLARSLQPSFTHVVRHSRGIPQYNRGHGVWRDQVESLVDAQPGLHLGGWGYHGVGVAHLAADANRIATRVAA